MTQKHFCDIDCLTNDCEVYEAAFNEMRAEMIREGLPEGLVAFESLNTSIMLLQNINALRYERMKEMHRGKNG